MLLIETILFALIFGLIWALLASLAMFTFERGHLFDFVREWLITLDRRFKRDELRLHLGYGNTFQGMEEIQDYYNDALNWLAMNNKWVKLLTCQICFSVNTGLWASIILGIVYFTGFNLFVFVVCSIASNYWFSQKV